MKIANNLYKVELKKSEEAVTGKIGLGWMAESLRHFGIKKMIRDESFNVLVKEMQSLGLDVKVGYTNPVENTEAPVQVLAAL